MKLGRTVLPALVALVAMNVACGSSKKTSSSASSSSTSSAAAVAPAATSSAAASAPAAAAGACKKGTTKKIAFMLKQQTAFRYLHADVPFFKKTAEAAGYEVLVQSAENDANKQVAQAENVITQKVDAIVIQPVDFNVAGAIADKATAAGIPIASYDDLILNSKIAAFIGRDPKEGGRVAAKAVLAQVPKGNYVLIGGDAGQTGSTQMQEGYKDVLKPAVDSGDVKIVADQFTPAWKTEPAQAEAENALTQNKNKVDAFLVSYDGMSLGVLQAVEGAKLKAGSIPITGQDMELAAMQAIVDGRQFGSVWPAPDEMAVAGAKTAVKMANCEDLGATDTINNKAADVPWVKTPISFVSTKEIADFACKHDYWQKVDEVYKNAPDKKPSC
ncbi:MAG: substrate-binding domain-containing protein [Actinomycetota bacterium]